MNKTLARRSACRLVTAAILSFTASAVHAAADSVKLGFITDLSGLYSDSDGQGGLEAIRMAIDDFQGKVNGKPFREDLAAKLGAKVPPTPCT